MMASFGPALRNIFARRVARKRVARTTRPTMMMTEFGISFLCPRRTGERVWCLPQWVMLAGECLGKRGRLEAMGKVGGESPPQLGPPGSHAAFTSSKRMGQAGEWLGLQLLPRPDISDAA